MSVLKWIVEKRDEGEWDNNLNAWDTFLLNESQRIRGNSNIVKIDLKLKD